MTNWLTRSWTWWSMRSIPMDRARLISMVTWKTKMIRCTRRFDFHIFWNWFQNSWRWWLGSRHTTSSPMKDYSDDWTSIETSDGRPDLCKCIAALLRIYEKLPPIYANTFLPLLFNIIIYIFCWWAAFLFHFPWTVFVVNKIFDMKDLFDLHIPFGSNSNNDNIWWFARWVEKSRPFIRNKSQWSRHLYLISLENNLLKMSRTWYNRINNTVYDNRNSNYTCSVSMSLTSSRNTDSCIILHQLRIVRAIRERRNVVVVCQTFLSSRN